KRIRVGGGGFGRAARPRRPRPPVATAGPHARAASRFFIARRVFFAPARFAGFSVTNSYFTLQTGASNMRRYLFLFLKIQVAYIFLFH
ncbi:hypothetical protein, partial [Burkholderia pseudomallei]|uniref:hypothetical protein n=4 Tax=Burkholderia pseudomallei TaxID=28450 RepID=UPI001C4BC6B8